MDCSLRRKRLFAGRNELLAIDACSALANAEEIYFINGGDSPEYAQRVVSTSGKQDGLYWSVSETQVSSPLGHFNQFQSLRSLRIPGINLW